MLKLKHTAVGSGCVTTALFSYTKFNIEIKQKPCSKQSPNKQCGTASKWRPNKQLFRWYHKHQMAGWNNTATQIVLLQGIPRNKSVVTSGLRSVRKLPTFKNENSQYFGWPTYSIAIHTQAQWRPSAVTTSKYEGLVEKQLKAYSKDLVRRSFSFPIFFFLAACMCCSTNDKLGALENVMQHASLRVKRMQNSKSKLHSIF